VNGTWQSISRWGENEGLDGDQQTAFEIFAVTYVLSFYDEAIVGATNLVTYEEFVERKNGLCRLARQDTNNKKPLCMFITGPAGAGKSKFRSRRLHSKTKKRNPTLLEKAKVLESLVSYAKQFSMSLMIGQSC
jgi:hypothetical protein